jgi:transposase-like protein
MGVFGRRRTIRSHGTATVTLRPRRVRCSDCESTHIVLPTAFQARHAGITEVIGQTLVHKANGLGYRRIAARLHRSESTVRRWLHCAVPHPSTCTGCTSVAPSG